MADFTLPFDKPFVEALVKTYPTPVYIYDEAAIRHRARLIQKVMDDAGVPGFRNFFAIKALPNPSILKILKEEGMGLDASSLAELESAVQAGVSSEDIMFSSNDTPREDFQRAEYLGAIINFDDLNQIKPFLSEFSPPSIVACRYNPGDRDFGDDHEFIIGKPSEAKYGMPEDQLFEAYKQLQAAGVKRFGLHTMLVSNELNWQTLEMTVETLFDLANRMHQRLGIQLEFINLGGGIGIRYRPEDEPFDLKTFAETIATSYQKHQLAKVGGPKIWMENGRYITGEAGYLITKVNLIKNTYKQYVGVDATMANLMRPGMYGAYHHIAVLGKENDPVDRAVDVVGSLCENNDKFAVNRRLPKVEVGDYLVVHSAGAHAHAMGFQYNGKLRSAELLLKPDKSVKLIRRAETLDDYFATLV